MLSQYFFVASAAVVSQLALSDPTLDKLGRDLIKGYTPFVYPGGNTSLAVGYSLISFEYDEDANILTSQIRERYTWKDPRLAWQPNAYNGISTIRLPVKMLWTPDIKLYNEYGPHEELEDVNAVVFNDGTVSWIPPAWYATRCSRPSINHKGTFNCTLKFGSWTYDGYALAPSLEMNYLDLNEYVNNDVYKLTSQSLTVQTAYYPCCSEPYPSIVAKIGFQRKPQSDG